ncbi:MAG: hypothetical protein DDT19_00252 [Syntrophomonadaceae bacterium]|nr:hypothetical protein [Bacillota bacterium]
MTITVETRKSCARRNLTLEQQKALIDLYFDPDSRLSTAAIGQQFDISRRSVTNIIGKHGLEQKRPRYPKKYFHNDRYFQEINEENSYWAGFIAADGCIVHCGTKSLVFHLQKIDHQQLINFAQCLSYLGLPKLRPNSILLRINGIYGLAQDLETNFNITTNKTFSLKPPPLQEERHIRAFLRGYFDGDGSFSCSSKHPKRTAFRLVGTKEFLTWVRTILAQYVGTNSDIKIAKYRNAYTLSYGGNRQAYRILTWLYKRSTFRTRLARKYNSFLDYQKWLPEFIANGRYPSNISYLSTTPPSKSFSSLIS